MLHLEVLSFEVVGDGLILGDSMSVRKRGGAGLLHLNC